MDHAFLAAEWNRIIAPRTGDVRTELVQDAAEFLGIPLAEAWQRHAGAGDRFRAEWLQTIDNPRDPTALTQFYNQSDTELFELIEWHANDAIHYRTLVLRDLASSRPGRSYLDYGSGIGNDALVFASAGLDVTLADISDCLLSFAAWRCRRRGFAVRTIDLKRESLPADSFDVVLCFDVLEHIPKPVKVVREIRSALRPHGLLLVHAPFGEDPVHPMHVVERDVVTPRMRSLGMLPTRCHFPSFIVAPQLYEKNDVSISDRAKYYCYDMYMSFWHPRLRAVIRRARRVLAPTTA